MTLNNALNSDKFKASSACQRLLCTAMLKPRITSYTQPVVMSCLCSDFAVEGCTTHGKYLAVHEIKLPFKLRINDPMSMIDDAKYVVLLIDIISDHQNFICSFLCVRVCL
jgi:hypothetical protein